MRSNYRWWYMMNMNITDFFIIGPTMKLKRHAVKEKYKDLISRLYRWAPCVDVLSVIKLRQTGLEMYVCMNVCVCVCICARFWVQQSLGDSVYQFLKASVRRKRRQFLAYICKSYDEQHAIPNPVGHQTAMSRLDEQQMFSTHSPHSSN